MSLIESNGVIKKPKVIAIYGVESVGKTELATQFPTTKFIDFEGGSRKYNVNRILPSEDDYFDVKEYINNHSNMKDNQTLVIDSMDWIERAMVKALMTKARVATIEGLGGYGAWKGVITNEWNSLMYALRKFVDKTQKDVVMLSHYEVKKFDDPVTAVPYDRYIMKLYPNHAAILREWCEAVLFANFQTYSKVNTSKDTKGKGVGNGVRMLYTEKRPAHDAKNRYSLPYEMPMDYQNLITYIDASPEDEISNIQKDIEEMFIDVKDQEILEKSKAYYEQKKNSIEDLKLIKSRLITIVDSQS